MRMVAAHLRFWRDSKASSAAFGILAFLAVFLEREKRKGEERRREERRGEERKSTYLAALRDEDAEDPPPPSSSSEVEAWRALPV